MLSVERFSWLGRDHRNPAVMDWQELCSILSQSTCPIIPVCLLSISPHTVLKTLCPSLLPLSAHQSLPSSPVPLGSSQPFPPIYSHCVSTSGAACICSEDRSPCVQQPALLHAPTPRLTLLLHGHLEPQGSPAQHGCLGTDMMEAAWWAAVNNLLPSIFTGP